MLKKISLFACLSISYFIQTAEWSAIDIDYAIEQSILDEALQRSLEEENERLLNLATASSAAEEETRKEDELNKKSKELMTELRDMSLIAPFIEIPEEELNIACPICHDPIVDILNGKKFVYELNCNHIMCAECLSWIPKTGFNRCPLCREDIKSLKIVKNVKSDKKSHTAKRKVSPAKK